MLMGCYRGALGRPIPLMTTAARGGVVFLLVPIVVGLIAVPVLGGRLGSLAELRLRLPWALPAALGLQVLIITVWPTGPELLLKPLHVASYLLAALFIAA